MRHINTENTGSSFVICYEKYESSAMNNLKALAAATAPNGGCLWQTLIIEQHFLPNKNIILWKEILHVLVITSFLGSGCSCCYMDNIASTWLRSFWLKIPN